MVDAIRNSKFIAVMLRLRGHLILEKIPLELALSPRLEPFYIETCISF